MHVKRTMKAWWNVLHDPKEAYAAVTKRAFEPLLIEYLTLLIGAAVLAGAYIFLETMLKAGFYDLFLDVNIQYVRLANYAMGGVTSISFFFLFAGTFFLFILSMILRAFYHKVRYVDLLKGLFLALTPTLFFGWIIWIGPAVLIWSIVLFLTGMPVLVKAKQQQHGTIRERE